MNELQVVQGNSILAQNTVGAELFDRFINYLDASPKTIDTYTKALRQLFNYFSLNGIRQPQREDIIAFRDELKASGHKPTTIQNYITATKLFFSWTAQEGYYPNIADHLKGAKLNRDHKKDYLTSRQVKEVLDAVERESLQGLRDYAILTLMVTGGLRTIEVIRADIGDLRNAGENTVLYVQGKGRTEKTDYIKLSPQVEKAIRVYLSARGETEETAPRTEDAPEGYKVNPLYIEKRSKRLQLLVQPSLYDKIKAKADVEGCSVNDFIHRVLEEAVKES